MKPVFFTDFSTCMRDKKEKKLRRNPSNEREQIALLFLLKTSLIAFCAEIIS